MKESIMNKFRFNPSKGLEFGVYTLGDHMPNPLTKQRISAHQRIKEIIELAKLAEQAGIDFFSVGESHQEYFTTQAHSVVLSAIAQATSTIKLGSSSTIISTLDPVRVFEDFATLDLISDGRIELVAGRASRVGNFELLGYNLNKYEEIFEEKLELLRLINDNETVTWHGEFRQPLKDAEILPRHYLVAEQHLKPILSFMKAQLVQSYVFAEQKDIVKGEIMNQDVLLRIDRLVDQIMQTDAAFRQMREMQEEMYVF